MSFIKTSPASSQVPVNEEEENRESTISSLPTTPTSIKRPRLMSKPVKNVRFADVLNEIPNNDLGLPENSFSSDELMEIGAKTTTEQEGSRSSGDRFVQLANFVKLSPRKNASEKTMSSMDARPSVITDDSIDVNVRTPSPLTPRRSALKRKTQDSDYEHSAQIPYRSPSLSGSLSNLLSGSRKQQPGVHRFTLSDSNIESSDDDCLFPSLRRCTDNITKLCFALAEVSRTSLLARNLQQNGITNIGQFAILTKASLEQIPYIKKPKYDNAMNYLKSYAPVNFEQSTPSRNQQTVSNLIVPKEESVETSLSPEHGVPIAGNTQVLQRPFGYDLSQATEHVIDTVPEERPDSVIIDQPLILTGDANDSVMEVSQEMQSVYTKQGINQSTIAVQTSPFPTTSTVQTSPIKQVILDQTIEDSIAEVSNSQVGNVLKKKIADLSRLVNDAFAQNANPKLTALESIREIHANFAEESFNKDECNEMITLLLDITKQIHEKNIALE